MTSQPSYIELTRRFSRSSDETASNDTSSSDLERAHRLPDGATKTHPHTPSIPQLVIRRLHDSLVLIIGALLILCICLCVRLVCLHSGLHRIPGDQFDNLFGLHVLADSPSIWDDSYQSFIREVHPIPIHSHNDYSQRIPLFEALGSGCISVEADVHLRNVDLLVGHRSLHLHPSRSLRTMYLDPLARMLTAQNSNTTIDNWQGIYRHASKQTVALLIDHKTEGEETYAMLSTQLQPLRDLGYLTHWNGSARILRPLTIVATGNAPFYNDDSYRDIFFDADLGQLNSIHDAADHYLYNISNSYYASTRWSKALSRDARISQSEIASQIESAKARGLLARYWDTPAQPPNMRDLFGER